MAELCARLKAQDVHIMVYSGYTYEELIALSKKDADIARLLGLCDILVDGRFEQSSRSLTLKFRGSRNQRIIDLPASLGSGHVVELVL